MADTTHKTLSDGVKCWKSINFYWNLVKYILRILFYIAAFVTSLVSSLFEILSDYFKTTEKAEDSPEKTIKNRCGASSFSNQTNKNEELKEVSKVINDTVNKLIDQECNVYFNHINKNEEQKEANKVISDIKNGLIENVTKECNDQSVFDHNIVAEQKILNGTIANIVNFKLDEESDPNYYGVEQKPLSQIPGESKENFNSKNSEKKIKKKIITCEDTGSARVKKRHPIKNTAMLLITKTINENKLRDKLFNFDTKSDKDNFRKENKLILNKEPEKTDCFEVADNSYNTDTSIGNASIYKNDSKNFNIHKNIEPMENQWEINENEKLISKKIVDHWENDNGNASENLITKTENMITSNNGKCQDNYDGIENRKPISKTENILNIFEVKDDIFGLPSTFSLAHCISEDFHISVGMTAEFKYKFGKIGALMDQQLRVSDVGHIIHNEQHVFYIVIKRKMVHRALLSTLEIALYNLRNKMNDLKLTKLAIPKYGLDSFNMIEVKELISKVFILSNIEVTICLKSSTLEIEHFKPPKVNFTFKQLWEMEKQTDIIIFINTKTVYSENWNDEVVEHINAKYPFKERLLKDINIKPMTHGDFLMYKIDTEILFCVFIKPFDQYSAYFRCLEKAFQEIKSHLTGYRYLGVQQEPLTYKPNQQTLTRSLAMLKSVFSNQDAEIWVCGDTEQHKALHYQQYKKIVNDAIEVNQKRNSKTNSKSKRKRLGANGNNSKSDLLEKHCSKNISNVNTVTYLNQEQISVDSYITENWDN